MIESSWVVSLPEGVSASAILDILERLAPDPLPGAVQVAPVICPVFEAGVSEADADSGRVHEPILGHVVEVSEGDDDGEIVCKIAWATEDEPDIKSLIAITGENGLLSVEASLDTPEAERHEIGGDGLPPLELLADRRDRTMYEEDETEMSVDELRAAIQASAGSNPVEQVWDLLRREELGFTGLTAPEQSRRVAEVLALSGHRVPTTTYAPARMHAVHHEVLGTPMNSDLVPLSRTTLGGPSSCASADFRGVGGRNRIEKAVNYLRANRPGFETLEWEQQITMASQFLRSVPGVLE